MAAKTLYEILEVASTATLDEIKGAYRRQAMKWHPDRNPGNLAEAERRFKEIGSAYKVLSDPETRAEYDAAQGAHKSYSYDSSNEDADSTFFDEMLDLAFELSRRGYPLDKILKMLLALDCPEAIARAVAKRFEELGATEHRSGHAGTGGGRQGQSQGPRREQKEQSHSASQSQAKSSSGSGPLSAESLNQSSAMQFAYIVMGLCLILLGTATLLVGQIFIALPSVGFGIILFMSGRKGRRTGSMAERTMAERIEAVIQLMESESPELAETSANFDGVAVGRILDAQKDLIAKGVEPDQALMQAYRHYLRARR